jgi:ATP-binding cassette subfamily B protein
MDGPTAGSAGRWLAVERLCMAVRPVVDVLARAAPRLAVAVVVLQLASGLITTGVLLASAAAINALLAHALNAERLRAALPAMIFLAVAFTIKLALEALTTRVRAELSPRVHRIAQAQLLEASLKVELAAFDDPGFYDQLHRARDRGVMHMETATDSLVDALAALVGVAGAALALFWLDPVLLPVLAVALLPQAWGAFAVARLHMASMPETVSLNRQVDMMIELATDRDNAPEIRSYQAQDYVSAEYARSADAMQAHLVQLGVAEARVRTLGSVLSALGVAFTFGVLGWLLWTDRLPLASAGATLFAVRTAGQALERLMQVGSSLFEKGLYLADYRAFIEQAAQRQRPLAGAQAAAVPALIELDRVGFHYAGRRDDPALRDISLSIRAGETIAFVGENGSGKTTLAKLIAGLYQPAEGHIRWDGTDIRDIDPRSLADRIAMVLQRPVRWPRSASHNVRVGRHARVDPGDTALKQAASDSRAQEVIDRLPQGWDTLLSRTFRGGVDLSGGQWQRLAVARGLFRDAPLVIWDEPTAPLDARAEHAVFESLRQLARNRTVILITHRLASVRNADRIFFLERGRLVEQGRHEDLLAADGRYAELYKLQTRLHALEAASTA